MAQGFKCLIGLHKYDEPDISEVKNHYGEVVRKIYVCRCSYCGKLYSKVVHYEPYR